MANKRKNRQPEEKSDVAEPAPNANPPDPAADAADEDGPELEPRTMWHRARVALLGSIGMLSQEEIEAEEAAERAREAKEAEAAAYEALPWIQKCGASLCTEISACKTLTRFSKERYPLKVNLLGIADVKIALDDAIRSILIDEGHFAEDNTHSNRKLILGYVAVVVALVSSAYSYFVPFSDSKALLGKGVFTYFVLVSVMWLYGLVVEKDCLFVGTQSDPLVSLLFREESVKTQRLTRSPTSESAHSTPPGFIGHRAKIWNILGIFCVLKNSSPRRRTEGGRSQIRKVRWRMVRCGRAVCGEHLSQGR